ncbi:hypothetical protein BJ742DRAFT_735472 [Cladochytrium replicatum]|nr:hypothetical protein BJ742DRAFT_735472 [Cladochytrium replicatum]
MVTLTAILACLLACCNFVFQTRPSPTRQRQQADSDTTSQSHPMQPFLRKVMNTRRISTNQKRAADDGEDRISSACAPRPPVVIPPAMLLSNVNLRSRSGVQEPPTTPPPPAGGRTLAERLVYCTHNMQRLEIANFLRSSAAELPQPAYPASRIVSHHLNGVSVTERGAPMRRSPWMARRTGRSNPRVEHEKHFWYLTRARAPQDNLRRIAAEVETKSDRRPSSAEQEASSDGAAPTVLEHFQTPLKRRRDEGRKQDDDEEDETQKCGLTMSPQSPSNQINSESTISGREYESGDTPNQTREYGDVGQRSK